LADVLSETNGVMVYQEQIMRILNRLGNIPLGDAYTCVKAISKKKDFSKFREQFVAGANENGLAEKKADDIFDKIVAFAGYGFNKSHSTAYAMVAYITAYLKAHYPVEFMAALLCGDISKRNFTSKDSTVEHIEDCQRMGIEVVPPDVNVSKQLYSVVDGKIVFALTAIKSCGDWAADKIVQAREKDGKYKDLFDLCERVDNKACNRATLETLIKAGAFDSTGHKRSQLFPLVESALKAGQGVAEDAAKGQGNLFGGDEPQPMATIPKGLPTIPEWTDKEKSNYEKEVLGFYLTAHPLKEFAEVFAMLRTHECSEATMLANNTQVVLAGTVGDIKIATGKNSKPDKPNRYAMFSLEDASGSVRSIMWSDAYEKFMEFIRSDTIVFMRGRMDRSRCANTTDSPGGNSPDGNFIVEEVFTPDEAPKKLCRGLLLTLDEERHSKESVETLLSMLRETPGNNIVELSLRLKDGATAIFRGGKTMVGGTPALYHEVTEFLGADSARVLRTAIPSKPQSNYRRA
jgi:DNA polymerase-3 subunit alpha